EEHSAHMEFAAVAHREPDTIRELPVGYREPETTKISAEQNPNRHRDFGSHFRRNGERLEFLRIDQSLPFPGNVLGARPRLKGNPIDGSTMVLLGTYQLKAILCLLL